MHMRNAIISGLLPMLCSDPTAAQYMVAEQEAVLYSESIGRITWTRPKDLKAIFAVPHRTAGPRIKCVGGAHVCDVEVLPRDISVTNEERLSQLKAAAGPLLQHAVSKALAFLAYGKDQSVIYVTVQDTRSSRYQTLGYALKGPAMIKFRAFTNTSADLVPILELVDAAKAVDTLEMWAFRFGDYKAACEDLFPQYKVANDNAFASSPFAAVDVAHFFLKVDPSLTVDKVHTFLRTTRTSFARNLDKASLQKKQALCEGLPQWITEAEKDLLTK